MNAARPASTFRTLKSANRSKIHSRWALLCALTSLLSSAALPSLADDRDPNRYRPGLRIAPGKKGINEKEREVILQTLREKSGFLDLGFDAAGFLSLGDRSRLSGGSQSARDLLIATVERNEVVELESAPRSPLVTFARLTNQTTFENRSTGQTIEACAIQIDFADFAMLQGDKQALAAFDVGYVMLHELGHAVLGLRDTLDDSPGECEGRINQIRRELNHPERSTYLARVYSIPVPFGMGRVKRAELVFRNAGKAFRLDWEALRVGPVVDGAVVAAARAKSGKPVSISVAGQ
jgi:hypothetical protein